MKIFSNPNFLPVYSGVLTATLAVVMLSGFTAQTKKASFEEIDVQRINIVEPDGTRRLIISDKARSPGLYIKGKEYLPDYRKTAGLIFLDDEGSESGGLIFGGLKDAAGNVSRYGHLSFDQYMQDQVFSIDAGEGGGQRRSAVTVLDRPDYPITEEIALIERIKNLPPEQQQAEIEKFYATHAKPQQRVFLGRSPDRSVALQLKDADGRDRIVIAVDANGNPRIQFLGADGSVVSQLPK